MINDWTTSKNLCHRVTVVRKLPQRCQSDGTGQDRTGPNRTEQNATRHNMIVTLAAIVSLTHAIVLSKVLVFFSFFTFDYDYKWNNNDLS